MNAWFDIPLAEDSHPYPALGLVPPPPAGGFDATAGAIARTLASMHAHGYPATPPEPRYPTIGDLAEAVTGPRPVLPVRDPGAALGRPRPAFTPHPVPAPEPPRPPLPEPEGKWLPGFLAGALADAAEGAGRRISEPCPRCPGLFSGWCEDCQSALARAAMYARLSGMLASAPGDRAAIGVLLAGEWRDEAAPLAGMLAEGDAP